MSDFADLMKKVLEEQQEIAKRLYGKFNSGYDCDNVAPNYRNKIYSSIAGGYIDPRTGELLPEEEQND